MEASPSLAPSLKPSGESTPQNDPDKALFTHWQATGDKTDFEEIDAGTGKPWMCHARRHLPPALAADAEDMVQETFTRLFNQRAPTSRRTATLEDRSTALHRMCASSTFSTPVANRGTTGGPARL